MGVGERQSDNVEEMRVHRSKEKGKIGPSW